MASRFGQFADPSAPPADLFNIWRDDYMLSPQQAAAEAAERAKNTLFDGVLPPFSNVGNTERDLGVIPFLFTRWLLRLAAYCFEVSSVLGQFLML
jgi:hypothetical protein